MQNDILCAMLALAHTINKNKTRYKNTMGQFRGCGKQQSSMRKPGIPPARIPEITKSSLHGMTFTSNTCVAGIRKVTSHSAKNSIILASSFGRIFWTALPVSMSGACVANPTVRGIIRQQVESAQFGDPLAWFLHIYCDLSQGPVISGILAGGSLVSALSFVAFFTL